MTTIYTIRHGQANTATPDYDRLTPLGVRQIQTLAHYFIQQEIPVSFVGSGTLLRHRQSASEFIETHKKRGIDLPELVQLPSLNELEDAVWRKIGGKLFFRKLSFVKAVFHWKISLIFTKRNIETNFFNVARMILLHWISTDDDDPHIPSLSDFREHVMSTLRCLPLEEHGHVVLFTSGVPILCFLNHAETKKTQVFDAQFTDLTNASMTSFRYIGGKLHLIRRGEVVF
jgi:broad specificity phosphatase PhoE